MKFTQYISHTGRLAKFDEYFDENFSVVIFALFFLVDDNSIYVAVLGTFVHHFAFQIFIHVLRTDHVSQYHHSRLNQPHFI